MLKKLKLFTLFVLITKGSAVWCSNQDVSDFIIDTYDREKVMKEIGRCPAFAKIAKDRDFVAAGVLAANPRVVAICPALGKVGRHLDRFERCMVGGLSQISELHSAPSKIGKLKAKVGISKQPYSNSTYQEGLRLEYMCKHPDLYPEVPDKTDL